MLKNISDLGWVYLTYGVMITGYFCMAAIGGWKFPDLNQSFNSGGSSYGRSYGGSWGGGK